MKEKTIIVITGPTAGGKSALAVNLARSLDTDIISADSRQIYRRMPIVTAVPDKEERGGIEHHLMEKLEPEDYFSASLFEEEALKICAKLFETKNHVIVCGGSMLYIDALCNGIDEIPTVPEDFRHDLMEEWRRQGDHWLIRQLYLLDRKSLMRIDPNNMKRIFHAVEISLLAGKPYSSFLTGKKRTLPYRIIKTALNGERELLFERINRRVDLMMEKGLLEEAEKLYPHKGLNSLNTVGLKEIFDYFEGKMTLPEALSRIKKNTRVYAKKQLTWFKKDKELKWLDFSSSMDENINKILTLDSSFKSHSLK